MIEGVLAIIHLILAVYAVIQIVQSELSFLAKVLWSLLVLIVPLVGLTIWFLLGPKSAEPNAQAEAVNVRLTASCQPSTRRSRSSAAIAGSNRRSSAQVLAKPSISGQTPAP